VIPAAVADSWLFWLAIIDGLAAVYILPTVIGIARQVEGLGLVICLNAFPAEWPDKPVTGLRHSSPGWDAGDGPAFRGVSLPHG